MPKTVPTLAHPTQAPRISAAEDKGAMELLQDYARINSMSSGAVEVTAAALKVCGPRGGDYNWLVGWD